MNIKSPVTGKENITLEKEIPSSEFIDAYEKEFGIDIKRFFKDLPRVGLYRCEDTGYRFFEPFRVAGDDAFYQELQKYPWYYMDEKWEHKIALKYAKKEDKVLEIGCARGGFLKQLKGKSISADGLEMNTDALKESEKAGLSVFPDSIETFSKKKSLYYDMVASFQVLEHVPKVKSFLDASLNCLKPGGKMVISVPNNDCLVLKDNTGGPLNGPPHHMGQWTMNSLIALQNHFPITIEAIHIEPLQKYHLAYALRPANKRVAEKLRNKIGPFAPLFEKITKLITYTGVSSLTNDIVGHSILVVFKKNND